MPGHIVAIVLVSIAVIIWPISVLIILFTRRFPVGLFNLYVDILHFCLKQSAYGWLLTDRWAFDAVDHPVEVSVSYPPDGRLNRWLPLVKWLLVLPHALCLGVCQLFVSVLLPFLWLYILFTGRVPASPFDILAGILAWNLNMSAYMYLLTDKYPPFGGQ